MQAERPLRGAAWLNLLLPGAGLVLAGVWTDGLLGSLLFVASANLALAANLLFPDDFGPWGRGLAILLAGFCYLGTQFRMLQATQRAAADQRTAARRAGLAAAQACLTAGDPASAAASLRMLAREFPDDLLVWYRLAEALAAVDDRSAATAAWQRVRELDRHGIYRGQPPT